MINKDIRLWGPEATAMALDEPCEMSRIVLHPNEFVLGCTLETLRLPHDLAGVISPLSHIARFGLSVTGGADLINPGHGRRSPSKLTLELKNNNTSPLDLDAGMPIARIRFEYLTGSNAISNQASSIYDGADPVCEPCLYEEWSGKID